MGLSLLGSLAWLLGVVLSLIWPGLVAIAFARWRIHDIRAPNRFLAIGIPLSYCIVLGSHAVLADTVLEGARRAAETGQVGTAWSPLVLVFASETALAVGALYLLHRWFFSSH